MSGGDAALVQEPFNPGVTIGPDADYGSAQTARRGHSRQHTQCRNHSVQTSRSHFAPFAFGPKRRSVTGTNPRIGKKIPVQVNDTKMSDSGG